MFRKVLIANRGEIAIRVARTLRELGVASAGVFTDADRESLHVRRVDEAVALGADPRAYLDAEQLVAAAVAAGCDAVHPGYGFLSENADFAELVSARGLTFVGPSASAIRAMGSKERARAAMTGAGVPVVPGGSARTLEEARATAAAVGYPLMVKATDGGGGKGMRLVRTEVELESALERTRSEAEKAFGNGDVYIEKALEKPRHVEVQVLGDREGRIVHLFERDCSLQRRHQKIVEETPCPVLEPATRAALTAIALQGARSLGYYSAGTFEFLLDADGRFYFLEMNTRLQVEHPITELVTGVDLVREMLRVAAGLPLELEPEARGAAIEARLCAEDPSRGFVPSPGRIEHLVSAAGPFVRQDSGIFEGAVVSPHYDPMFAKLAVWAPTRAEALARLLRALGETLVLGVDTNVAFLERLLSTPDVAAGLYDTGFVERRLAELLATARHDDDGLVAAAAVGALVGNVHANFASRPDEGLSPWVAAERAERLGRP
ncbi:MAG TPA: biotin carboxylase N-terminal domain-containing protein [Polyangiaceae bacterium]|jgi:acetyl-CoA carboxylase biotin carboxylase subunit|nr:biotin carboxylase N-terminal domain-containing protein [Polyangiaceae bacterium]